MKITSLFLFIILLLSACTKEYVPKPRGYFRISFPEKDYKKIDNNIPYQFNIPTYSFFMLDTLATSEPFWANIAFPENNAELHISYKEVDNNLAIMTEESRSLAYKHSIKADAIDERIFINKEKKVFGTIYYIDGNAASPVQFFLTDSNRHFLRGALYISEIPNIDSIRPVIDYLKTDIIQIIETTNWNSQYAIAK